MDCFSDMHTKFSHYHLATLAATKTETTRAPNHPFSDPEPRNKEREARFSRPKGTNDKKKKFLSPGKFIFETTNGGGFLNSKSQQQLVTDTRTYLRISSRARIIMKN